MELRVLGTHNYESRDTRLASYVIDGVLALDAGSFARSLTFDEQRAVTAVILSHRHLDHVRDVVSIGLHARAAGITVDVYGIADTIDYIRSDLLAPPTAPDFTKFPSADKPAIRYHTVEFHREFQVLGYTAEATPVPHAVPAAGFQVIAGDVKLFYTGDAGQGLSAAWQHVKPDVLLSEVTYGNENESKALEVGHMTPRLLGETLSDFKARWGFLPRVIVSHMNPPWEAAVRAELAELSERMGVDIQVAEPDMTFSL